MSKLKKVGLIAFIIVVVLGAVISYFVIQINDDLEFLKTMYIEDVDLTLIDDGNYYGTYSVFPVEVELIVTVEDHEITTINIIRHMNGQGEPAEVIVDDIIESQTLQVDAIAGATYSSKVILLAVQNALLNES